MKNNYFSGNKHKYMKGSSQFFADYIFSLIKDRSFSNYDTVIELGAGMGRFSTSLFKNFSNVILVEPTGSYSDILTNLFPEANLQVVNAKAEKFLSDYTTDKAIIIFCFHLMHHLTYEQRKEIYRFVKRTGSKCVMVEPNPFNPLVFLQILFHPDMSFPEEKRYLSLTRRKYKEEFVKNGLVMSSFRRICFFPPFVTAILLEKIAWKAVYSLEALSRAFPFISSYQLIICEELVK